MAVGAPSAIDYFRSWGNPERFVSQLAERVEQLRIRLFQFSLMANPDHLVFETPEDIERRLENQFGQKQTVNF